MCIMLAERRRHSKQENIWSSCDELNRDLLYSSLDWYSIPPSWKMEMFGYHVRITQVCARVCLSFNSQSPGLQETGKIVYLDLFASYILILIVAAGCCILSRKCTWHNPFKHIYTCIHNRTASATLKGSFFSQAKKTSFRVHFVFPYWFWLAFISARPLKSILFSVYISVFEWVNSLNRGALWGKEKQGLITFVCQRGGDA